MYETILGLNAMEKCPSCLASTRPCASQVVAEWHMLVDAAKTPSAYLSSFHAFVLANALRRPILVYGDRFVRGKDGEPYAPSDVRG